MKHDTTGISIDNDKQTTIVLSNRNISKSNATVGTNEGHSGDSNVWLAGIILDTSRIQERVWKSIVHLNCQHNVGIHIVAKLNVEKGLKMRDSVCKSFEYSRSQCAPFIIHQQDDQLFASSREAVDNRIDRISILRDHQRNSLMKEAFSNDTVRHHGGIILADLDLFKFPPVELIVDQIELLKGSSYPHDAICAIGTTLHFEKKGKPLPFYYDTYSTVFLPDTFSHPLSRRLIPHLYLGEDPRLVRSNDQVDGNFTQADIWKYFVEKGKQHRRTGNVPVRSCFGGFTIYRSKVYFEEGCQYKLNKDIIEEAPTQGKTILRYASSKEKRPCEHIVFHDCLVQEQSKFNIAVNPNLVTLWQRDKK